VVWWCAATVTWVRLCLETARNVERGLNVVECVWGVCAGVVLVRRASSDDESACLCVCLVLAALLCCFVLYAYA